MTVVLVIVELIKKLKNSLLSSYFILNIKLDKGDCSKIIVRLSILFLLLHRCIVSLIRQFKFIIG